MKKYKSLMALVLLPLFFSMGYADANKIEKSSLSSSDSEDFDFDLEDENLTDEELKQAIKEEKKYAKKLQARKDKWEKLTAQEQSAIDMEAIFSRWEELDKSIAEGKKESERLDKSIAEGKKESERLDKSIAEGKKSIAEGKKSIAEGKKESERLDKSIAEGKKRWGELSLIAAWL